MPELNELEREAQRRGIPVEQLIRELMLDESGPVPRADLTTAYNPTVLPPEIGGQVPTAPTPNQTPRNPVDYYPAPPLSSQFAYLPPGEMPQQPYQFPGAPEPYQYPETSSGLGHLGNLIGKVSEHYTTESIKYQSDNIQSLHAEELAKYNSLPDGVMKNLAEKNLLMLEKQYDQLLYATQTAGSGPRALGAVFENPSLLPMWGDLTAETPGQLGYQIPALMGRLTPVPGSIGTTPGFSTRETAGTPAFTDLTQFLSPIAGNDIPTSAQKVGDFGTFGKTGDFGAFGEKPSAPPSGAGVPSPDNRGFATWDALRAGMEAAGRWTPNTYNEPTNMYIGPTNIPQGGGAAGFSDYVGGSGAVDRVTADIGQGTQDYIVRRDGMGNIQSMVATSSIDPVTKDKTSKPWLYY